MKLETRAQIARTTLFLLTLVTSLFAIGTVVLISCLGLHINPFQANTASLLMSIFFGLLGFAIVLVLLNVATNISLIAEAKIVELKIEPKTGITKKYLLGMLVTAIAIVSLLYAANCWSKDKHLQTVGNEAQQVVKENGNLISEVGTLLSSGKPKDYKRIAEICYYLNQQRADLPNVTIIYSGRFDNNPTLYSITGQFYYCENKELETYKPNYFPCTQEFDCDYLKKFFAGGAVETFKKYKSSCEYVAVYVPVVSKEVRFIMLFSGDPRYGYAGRY